MKFVHIIEAKSTKMGGGQNPVADPHSEKWGGGDQQTLPTPQDRRLCSCCCFSISRFLIAGVTHFSTLLIGRSVLRALHVGAGKNWTTDIQTDT